MRNKIMTAKGWRIKIKTACVEAGTYKDCFDSIINTLADILTQRDRVYMDYVEGGEMPVIKYTNKGGQSNPVKNPYLVIWDSLNERALSYWKELGLTPSGLKRINEEALTMRKSSSFADILNELSK